jgi:hypothetical protein
VAEAVAEAVMEAAEAVAVVVAVADGTEVCRFLGNFVRH